MRRIKEAALVGLLTAAMLNGCNWTDPGVGAPEITSEEQTGSGQSYLDKTAIRDETDTQKNTAVDAALEWARKYSEASAKRDQLLQENRDIVKKQRLTQQQIADLQLELKRAEKELGEANEMLLEMRRELKKWKSDVLGFRNEIRRSQKAQLDAMTRILTLIGGEVAPQSPTTQPAGQMSLGDGEQTGETVQ